MAEMTPMMQQYLETKKEYPDCLLLYRLGDFYEMFFEDAITASRELEITLTGKNCGLEERAPMCGVPYHALEGYLNKLVQKGYKVAICEQMEDPKQAKGIVKREVVRIVTPGTNLDVQAMDADKNNYIMSIACFQGKSGISIADVTTGDYYLTEAEDSKKLLDEIHKYLPSEIICNDAFLVSGIDLEDLKGRLHVTVYSLEPHFYDEDRCRKCLLKHFHVNTLQGMGIEDFPAGLIAAGALLQYLYDTQKTTLAHFTHLYPYLTSRYMLLDSSTRRNLELTETLREKQKRGSLLWVLDKTKTAMGARTMRQYIEQPLVDKAQIEERLNTVEVLCLQPMARDEMREYMNPIYDLERILGKISYKTANPRDLLAFCNSLKMLPHLKTLLSEFDEGLLRKIDQSMDDLSDLCSLIERSIDEESPVSVREGGIIRTGFDKTIDNLRSAKTQGKNWLAQLEEDDRARTGIKNLKIKYNKVFGYYFEVTNSYQSLVPEDYIRKQTLANAERYTNPRLKELEDSILNAEDKLYTLEYDMFCKIRDAVAGQIERIQKTAKAYMRQSALIVLMAQIGCFVPADRADIGIVDRIFTRVGASDDLASGQSTFMVEMNEVANILRNATADSLLILDEIGRGTSTFDGLSIAWAVIEHISNKKLLGAKTLFATHYHELTELEGKMSNVNNYCIAVKEKGDDIIFLRKIVKGGADRSYGIQVAKLAGVPDMVIDRAKEIAGQLSDNDITEKVQSIAVDHKSSAKKPVKYDEVDLSQMSLFDTVRDEDVVRELTEIDISNLTPLDALNTLYRLQNKLKNRW